MTQSHESTDSNEIFTDRYLVLITIVNVMRRTCEFVSLCVDFIVTPLGQNYIFHVNFWNWCQIFVTDEPATFAKDIHFRFCFSKGSQSLRGLRQDSGPFRESEMFSRGDFGQFDGRDNASHLSWAQAWFCSFSAWVDAISHGCVKIWTLTRRKWLSLPVELLYSV